MSESIRCKSKINNVNREILGAAIKALAKQFGYEIRDYVDTYHNSGIRTWEGNKVEFGLFSDKVHRGIGVIINEKGEVEFVGDPHNCRSDFNKMKKQIEAVYSDLYIAAIIQIASQEAGALEVQRLDNAQTGLTTFIAVEGEKK